MCSEYTEIKNTISTIGSEYYMTNHSCLYFILDRLIFLEIYYVNCRENVVKSGSLKLLGVSDILLDSWIMHIHINIEDFLKKNVINYRVINVLIIALVNIIIYC